MAHKRVHCTHCGSPMTSCLYPVQFLKEPIIDYRCNDCNVYFSLTNPDYKPKEERHKPTKELPWSPYSQRVNSLSSGPITEKKKKKTFAQRWMERNRDRKLASLSDIDLDRPQVQVETNPEYTIITTCLEIKQ